MSYARTIPIRGSEVSRRAHEASVVSGDGAMQPGEYHSSTDAAGFTRHFIAHRHVGGYLYHGDVSTEAAMLALDRPAYAHACFPGDTCRRTDIAGSPIMLCIAGHGTLAADWVPQSDPSALIASKADTADVTALEADVTALEADVTALEADVTGLTALSQEVDNLTLSDSGPGVSLIAATPFGLRKLVAGAGVTLAIVGSAIEISAETSGGPEISGSASDTFAGITLGEIDSVSTGWGWSASGTSEASWLPHAEDNFAGIPIGTVTSVTTGSGWTGAGTSSTP